ncbi:hypothetical protein [Rubripirellula obstinata]|nr:hypothetical protein [Rubripirellula obstinata]
MEGQNDGALPAGKVRMMAAHHRFAPPSFCPENLPTKTGRSLLIASHQGHKSHKEEQEFQAGETLRVWERGGKLRVAWV